MWWLLLISLSVFAQDESLDLEAVEKLSETMPDYQSEPPVIEFKEQTIRPRKYVFPDDAVTMAQITTSGVGLGTIKAGSTIVRLEDDQKFAVPKNMNVQYYRLEDGKGFKYLVSKGKSKYKVIGDLVIETNEESKLFEPPDQYTLAPKNVIAAEYDRKLFLAPEPIFYAGFVDGSYMKDLFNDDRARYGKTTQFGLRGIAKFNWPVQAGLVFSYERSTYDLRNDGRVIYTSPSIGPMFRTRNFSLLDFPFRFQTQIRYSPFARADIVFSEQKENLKFNSSDFLVSIEHPVKNGWGEFVLGTFFQAQWLNIKDQQVQTKVIANNQTNNSFGISLSQVFE
jgi:hypothetical protein